MGLNIDDINVFIQRLQTFFFNFFVTFLLLSNSVSITVYLYYERPVVQGTTQGVRTQVPRWRNTTLDVIISLTGSGWAWVVVVGPVRHSATHHSVACVHVPLDWAALPRPDSTRCDLSCNVPCTVQQIQVTRYKLPMFVLKKKTLLFSAEQQYSQLPHC